MKYLLVIPLVAFMACATTRTEVTSAQIAEEFALSLFDPAKDLPTEHFDEATFGPDIAQRLEKRIEERAKNGAPNDIQTLEVLIANLESVPAKIRDKVDEKYVVELLLKYDEASEVASSFVSVSVYFKLGKIVGVVVGENARLGEKSHQ